MMLNIKKEIYEDIGIPLSYWDSEIEVKCPNCSSPSLVEKKKEQIKFICLDCGKYNLDHLNKKIHFKGGKKGVDPFFNYELYLKEETSYGTLWVYNAEHLFHLKAYIKAKERIKKFKDKYFDYYQSYFHKLPSWVKIAKNRDIILTKIALLEKRTITQKKSKTSAVIAKEVEESFFYRWNFKYNQSWRYNETIDDNFIYYLDFNEKTFNFKTKKIEPILSLFVRNLKGQKFTLKELVVDILKMDIDIILSEDMIVFEKGDYLLKFSESAFSNFRFGFTKGVMKKIVKIILS